MIDSAYFSNVDSVFTFREGLISRAQYVRTHGKAQFHKLPKFNRAYFSADRPQMQIVWAGTDWGLDLGIVGGLVWLFHAEVLTHRDIDKLFDGGTGGSRSNWNEFTRDVHDLFHGIDRDEPEYRSRMYLLWLRGRPIFDALGINPPVWITSEAANVEAIRNVIFGPATPH